MKARTNWVPNTCTHLGTPRSTLEHLFGSGSVAEELTGPIGVSGTMMLLGLLAHAKKIGLQANPPTL
jgi:hypothetical protein